MQQNFKQQLSHEMLLSEKRRTVIIILIFTVAFAYRVFQLFVIGFDEETARLRSFAGVWLFPLAVISFEVLSLVYINK